MSDEKRVDKLLADLLDYHVEGGAVSSFGDTGYDPGVDFPVCRRAVEELISMGDEVIPRLLGLITPDYSEQSYFAAEVLGRLGAVEAIQPLEKLVRSQASVTRRVNYDQFIGYPIYEPALDALLRLDRVRALRVLEDIVEKNASDAHWAKARLAALT